MGSIVQLGDVPAWIGAATGAASLYVGLRNRQQTQALDFAQTLEKLAGLTPLELRQTVEDNPVIAQMVDLAWEEAARTASKNKRRLLAKVVAAALRGDDSSEIDELQFLLRTVMALDPAHVNLLVIVAMPSGVSLRHPSDAPWTTRKVDRRELVDRWRGRPELLDAALAALEREGLIIGGNQGLRGPTPSVWDVGPYGRRFFDFLVRSGEAEPPG